MTGTDHPALTPDADAERRRWAASGEAWDRWADPLAEAAERVNAPLLALADLQPGQTVLDLASGAGEPALTSAARVGPSGLVLATDLVAPMLAGARRRAASQGLGTLRFLLADMQALPLAAGSVDRVTCRFGLMFVPDAVAATAEMARVLRPGGRAVTAVWGDLADNTLFRELAAAVDETLGPAQGDGLAALFRFAQAGASAALLRAGGLTMVEETALHLSLTVAPGRPFWRPTLEMAFAPRLAAATPAQREALEQAAAANFAALAGPEGIPLTMHIKLAVGRKA